MQAHSIERILVIRGGAIGDFILTLPVLAALRHHFPKAHLEILGYPHIAQLAIEGGLADAVRPIESPALTCFFVPRTQLNSVWTEFFAQADLIISYLHDPENVFFSNLSRCTSARIITGKHRPDQNARTHAVDVLLAPLRAIGISDADPMPRLRLDPPPEIAPMPGCWLSLHPGSGSQRKNWPETNWAELLAELVAETNLMFLLVGGEAEGDRVQRLAKELPASRVAVAHSLPLPTLARKFALCAGYVGHDSGISHLAAALDLPGSILWGDSNEAVWRPRNNKMMILRHPAGLDGLPVSQVKDRLHVLFSNNIADK